MLYFHGWPACRLEAGMISGLPVRLLALDRPGYGESTSQPGRRLADWPDDVARVTEALDAPQFHLVGLSGGAPFATACAVALPERVLGLALITPVPPAYPVAGKPRGAELLYHFGRRPWRARVLMTVAWLAVRFGFVTPDYLVKRMPSADRAVLTEPVLELLHAVWQESLRHGVAGALQDTAIYAADWSFAPSEIRVPTSVWVAGLDTLVSAAGLGPYRAIPGVRWHVLPEDAHLSLPLRHADDILRELVPQLSSSASQ